VFERVPQAMNFLLLQVLAGFDADVITGMLSAGFAYYALFLLYVLVASLTLMNMLIGVLCDVVSGVARDEKKDVLLKEIEMSIDGIIKSLDTDNDAMISKEEFQELFQSPLLVQKLDDLGVDVLAFVDFAHFVFNDCELVNFASFFKMLTQFHGDKAATVKDIVDVRKFVSMEFSVFMSQLERRLSSCAGCSACGERREPSKAEARVFWL